MQSFVLLFPNNTVKHPLEPHVNAVKHDGICTSETYDIYTQILCHLTEGPELRIHQFWYLQRSRNQYPELTPRVAALLGNRQSSHFPSANASTALSGQLRLLFLECSWTQGPRDGYTGVLWLFMSVNRQRLKGRSCFKTWLLKAVWESCFTDFLTPRFSRSQE